MSAFTVYDTTTGEILRSGTAPQSMVNMQAAVGEAVLEAEADDALEYVDVGTLTVEPKQAMAPTTTITTGQVEIGNLPNPTTVVWQGQEAVITDGVASITFDEPGDYSIVLRSSPMYLDHTLEVSIP